MVRGVVYESLHTQSDEGWFAQEWVLMSPKHASEISELMQLVDTSAEHFVTLRGTVRDWSRHRRISELQGLGSVGGTRDAVERVTRIWIDEKRRVREESDSGDVRVGLALTDLSHWPLVDGSWFARERKPKVLGRGRVAGRDAITVETFAPAAFLLPGSNRCVGAGDSKRGVLLRCDALLDEELLMLEELLEVEFDKPLDGSLFSPV